MIKNTKTRFAKGLVLSTALLLGGCANSATDSPKSAVRTYVKAVISGDAHQLNKVVYMGHHNAKQDYEFIDGKILGFGHGFAAKVKAHGGLRSVRILKVTDAGKEHGVEVKHVDFEVVCNDGKILPGGSPASVWKSSRGWKVNPMG